MRDALALQQPGQLAARHGPGVRVAEGAEHLDALVGALAHDVGHASALELGDQRRARRVGDAVRRPERGRLHVGRVVRRGDADRRGVGRVIGRGVVGGEGDVGRRVPVLRADRQGEGKGEKSIDGGRDGAAGGNGEGASGGAEVLLEVDYEEGGALVGRKGHFLDVCSYRMEDWVKV